ncbi:AraC family transcriptional regulator [Duganella callida]|uniref:AraC family transcriptional regulator n=1 Tax=Duganella callida TaxID=2561932 RepID=A0A4Y9SAT7_9BURK|nr:AraC family transcriptional regulator [Duganella callida]TFW16697.1 AraC family transcriptional regulator [Duganella callida]
MSNDPFSDILKLANAEPVVTGGFSAGGDWALHFPARDKIKFFAVVKGRCWVHLDGEPAPLQFSAGDVGLLAVPRSFVMCSAPGLAALDAHALFSGAGRSTVQLGDGGEFTQIGGHVELDPVRGRLLADVLPPWIQIRADTPHARVFGLLLDQLVDEKATQQPGTQLASAQLTQLLFIQILRAHLRSGAPMPSGWLRALAHPRIAPALRLMHAEPGRAWRLEDLAAACAMSRTTFAAHFTATAGVAPLTYLTQWRMRLAERALREENRPVALIAGALGYTSESAFSNAFKRVTGLSPRAYRQAGAT